VRAWIDISNSPQVQVFRPLVRLLRERGHDVSITTRHYAQTVELLELHGLPYEVVGPPHGGRGLPGKARAAVSRLRALRQFGGKRRFDVALSHASHELQLAARSLGIPSSYAFDYEHARVQHGLGSRAARRVVVPEAIPQKRLDVLGARATKVHRYPGLKEEYYLADFEPDESVLDALDLNRDRVLVVVRTPPDVSLYHRHGSPLFDAVLNRLGTSAHALAVVFPRTSRQREAIAALGFPSVVLPGQAIDALSLIALSDLVISAGGTMNREAAALGVPVYTTFAGRIGAVDETLIRDGRVEALRSPDDVRLVKRPIGAGEPIVRDPGMLLDLLLSTPAG
jgi:predicted glycosyltransferase